MSAASAAVAPLTKREREVFELHVRGYVTKEIATQLGISVKTVETYRARIAEKLGTSSRADHVAIALRVGLLTP